MPTIPDSGDGPSAMSEWITCKSGWECCGTQPRARSDGFNYGPKFVELESTRDYRLNTTCVQQHQATEFAFGRAVTKLDYCCSLGNMRGG